MTKAFDLNSDLRLLTTDFQPPNHKKKAAPFRSSFLFAIATTDFADCRVSEPSTPRLAVLSD